MTQDQIDSFREWHERRMQELQYPVKLVERLRSDRERWFPKAKN